MSTGLFSGLPGLSIDGGLYKGVQGLWSGLSGFLSGLQTSLSLDFLSGTTLDPRITFSRTTNATLVDATGELTYAPNNLVTYSEQFEAWTKVASTIAPNTTVAPNNTTTADKLVEDTSVTTGHFVQPVSSGGLIAGQFVIYSVYAKAGERTFVQIILTGAGPAGVNVVAGFDLINGTAGTPSATTTSTITSVGNGWYRCSIAVPVATTVSSSLQIRLALNSTATPSSYTGDGVSGLFIWGAQLEQVTYQTAPSTYNSTSPANLLGFTEEFDNAAWSKSSATVTANATIAPDGTTNADALIENTAVSAFHYINQSVTKSAANIPVAGSFYLKNKGRQISFSIQNAGGSSGVAGRVNPATGAVTATATAFGTGFTAGTLTMTDVGNGWYRVAMTATSDTSTSITLQLALHNGTTAVYTGDGVSGAFLWGAQLSNSASVDPYIYNPAAAPTSIAYYGPRFDYNPVTLAANGLLIEEQRTNLVLYSEDLSNAIWVKNGVTVSANVAAAPTGATTADKVIPTVASSSFKELQQSFSSVTGTTYTYSAYIKADGYSFIQLVGTSGEIGTMAINFDLSTGTETAFTAGTSTVLARGIIPAGNNYYRIFVTITAIGTNAGARIGVDIIPAANSARGVTWAGDGTSGILQWGAQLEVGAFATSYVPTVASTVTRAVDIVSMLGSNFSSWYNQSQGTIIPQFVATTTGVNTTGGFAFPFVYEIDSPAATTSNHALVLSSGYGPGWRVSTAILGVEQAGFQGVMPLGNTSVRKIAYAYQTNNFAASANGNAVLTDTSGNLPTPDRLSIGGQNTDGGNSFTGYIRAFTYYPARLTDAQLQEITSPSLVTTLSLGFLSGVLDPRITFSRTTNATLVDATGRVTYAPNNLLTNSEAFENAAWTKSNLSISANTSLAPNNTITADKLVSSATTSSQSMQQSLFTTSTNSHIYTIYAKAAEYSFVRVRAVEGTPFTRAVSIDVDLLTGATVRTSASSGAVLTASSVTSVGNGWFRISLSFVLGGASNLTIGQAFLNNGTDSFNITGDGASGVFVWGAQLELVTYQTTPGTYNSTSPANLLGFTEEFDNAAWTKSNATVTANATSAPNSTVTADKLVENNTTGQHRFFRTVSGTINTSPHTVSFYAKAGERTRVYVGVAESSTFVRQGNAVFDLSTGTVVSASAGTGGASGGSATIQALSNGWYRCSYTLTLGGTDTSIFVDFNLVSTGTTISYTGDGTSGAFFWGAQLSNSASLDPYVYNPAAALTSTAYYGPRFDYNPTTLAVNGLLIEEQRVNLLTYSDQFNNAAWTKTRASITANVIASPDGTLNADKLVEDTSVTTSHFTNRIVTASASTAYTQSIFVKAAERTKGQLQMFGNSGGSTVDFDLVAGTATATGAYGGWTSASATITNYGNGWYRITNTVTTNVGLTAVNWGVYLNDVLYTGDGVSGFYIWGAELEAGAFATSYIPTVASTVTRAADVAVMLGTNFSNWYNQSEGTLYAQALTFNSSTGKYPWSVHNGTGTELIAPYFLNANGGGFVVDGTTQAQIETAGLATLSNIALAVRLNDFAMSINANPVGTDNAGTMPTPDQMQIGNRADGARTLNGHVRQITYYPVRLSDRQLQVATI